MRSDFLDRFQSSSPLLDLRYEVLSLGPLSESDIAEIIEEPAKEKDVELEAGLVAALVKDAGSPNALPLLAFTLRELWERYANDGRITLEEYRDKLGGVQKVVGEAADNVLKSARMTQEQNAAAGRRGTALYQGVGTRRKSAAVGRYWRALGLRNRGYGIGTDRLCIRRARELERDVGGGTRKSG